MTEPATLPQYLLRNAAIMPRRVAFREKRCGIWRELSWRAYADMARAIAAWLAAQGFGPGQRLAVLGENRPQLYAAMLAAQSLGGAGVPLHPDAEIGRIVHILHDSRASTAIVEETDQAEMLLAARDRLPELTHVAALPVCAQPQDGVWESHATELIATVAAGLTAQNLALLLYPWEPDKLPRPLTLTHAELLTAAERITAAEEVRAGDRTLAYLPLGSLADAVYTQALGLKVGFSCNCPEGPHTTPRDLHEIGPTILVAPPRLLELLAHRLDSSAVAASPLKRWLYSRFTSLAEAAEQRRENGLDVPVRLRIATLAGEIVIHAPLRDQLGLGRVRWVHLTNQPMSPTLARRFRAIGVRLRPAGEGAGAAAGVGTPAHV